MSKLRIVYITNNFRPYSGGVVSSILAYTKILREFGHEVIIISLDFLGNQYNDESYVIRLYCPLKFSFDGRPCAVPWRSYMQIKMILDRFNPDIIHVHHPFLLGFSAGLLAKELAIPVVFTYHTLYEHYLHYVPIIPRWISRPLMQYRVRAFVKLVDHVIAPSRYVKNFLEQQNLQKSITILPSPLRERFFSQTHKKNIKNIYDKPFKLVTVSRFEKEKNLFSLLDVFALLDQNKFTFTLVGYGSQTHALMQYAYQNLKLPQDSISFIIRPPLEDIILHYATAHLFLFASQSETQGLVLAESMACATPVIAYDGPGQRDIIENGKNGYLVNGKEQMRSMIIDLEKDRDKLLQLSQCGIKTAEKYHPQFLLSNLLSIYRSVLDR